MKSTEPNLLNGGTSKPPPYPVEPSTPIDHPPAPDAHSTDLVSAVQYGYLERVVELIEAAPHLVSASAGDNITLLHWAAINNRVDIAKYLINKRAEVDAVGGELASTPLHWAIRDGKLDMVVFLLSQHAQPALIDGEGFTGLHLASMFGHLDIVAYLLAKGQAVDVLDKHAMTPLMHAVRRTKSRDPTQLLIRMGAEVNYQSPKNKYTALHYAIAESNQEGIQMLIDAGARTDLRNAENETVFDLVKKMPRGRSLLQALYKRIPLNTRVPKYLQMSKSTRRLGTKLFPYIAIFLVACLFQWQISLIYKGIAAFVLSMAANVYMKFVFDLDFEDHLPIAIAQASIFWLYTCYLYFFLEYLHVISVHMVLITVWTYLSWSNYYLAEKQDPGFILSNRDQLNRTIIQLVEQNQFDYTTFCTWCLIRRPMRSKHCKECHRCVSKFDHHCPWIANCVGEKNLRYFMGFLFFTPLCLAVYMHGAYLYYRYNCHLFASETVLQAATTVFTCNPAVVWFTAIATLHITWISALCFNILSQIITGYTTNEKMNFWRYAHLRSSSTSPFSLGYVQNLVDLINRPFCGYTPVTIDWSRIYSLEDFYQAIPIRLRQKLNLPLMHSSVEFPNV